MPPLRGLRLKIIELKESGKETEEIFSILKGTSPEKDIIAAMRSAGLMPHDKRFREPHEHPHYFGIERPRAPFHGWRHERRLSSAHRATLSLVVFLLTSLLISGFFFELFSPEWGDYDPLSGNGLILTPFLLVFYTAFIAVLALEYARSTRSASISNILFIVLPSLLITGFYFIIDPQGAPLVAVLAMIQAGLYLFALLAHDWDL